MEPDISTFLMSGLGMVAYIARSSHFNAPHSAQHFYPHGCDSFNWLIQKRENENHPLGRGLD